MDAFSGVAEFVRITAAKVHDCQFLHHLKIQPNSWIVFDNGYHTYSPFAKWIFQKIGFATRMRDNAVCHVCKVLKDKSRIRNAMGVIKEQIITIRYKDSN